MRRPTPARTRAAQILRSTLGFMPEAGLLLVVVVVAVLDAVPVLHGVSYMPVPHAALVVLGAELVVLAAAVVAAVVAGALVVVTGATEVVAGGREVVAALAVTIPRIPEAQCVPTWQAKGNTPAVVKTKEKVPLV